MAENNIFEIIKALGMALLGSSVLAAVIQSRSSGKIDQSAILNTIRKDQETELGVIRAEMRAEMKELRESDEKKERELDKQSRKLDRLTILFVRFFRNMRTLLGKAKTKMPDDLLLIEQIENDGNDIEKELQPEATPRPPP